MKSKAWLWEIVRAEDWQEPSADYYYVSHKWHRAGFSNILDLGCGLGRHALAFAQEGFNVSACDLSAYAVDKARSVADSINVNIDFATCDMLATPYADGMFDAVFAYRVISHTDTKGMQDMSRELSRIVRPGGEVYIDFISKASPQYINATNRVDENTIIMEEIPEEYGLPHFFVEADDIYGILKDFEIISIVKKTHYEVDKHKVFSEYYMVNARKMA